MEEVITKDMNHCFMALLACVNVGLIPSQYIAIAILYVMIGCGTLIDANIPQCSDLIGAITDPNAVI